MALALPLYAIALVPLARRRGWDLWSAFTAGNAALCTIAVAVISARGAWPAVVGRPSGGAALAGALAGSGVALLVVGLVWLPGELGRGLARAGVGGTGESSLAYRLLVQVLLCTVLFEELCFRGVLYALWAAAPSGSIALAVWGTTLSFAVWHAALLADMFAGWSAPRRVGLTVGGLLAYGLLGALLALLRAATGTLLAPLAAHGLLDLLMIGGMALRARRAGDV
jgi:membrane protease YdiL (CAAX protease family)